MLDLQTLHGINAWQKKQLILEKERVCNLIPKNCRGLEMDFWWFLSLHISPFKSWKVWDWFFIISHKFPIVSRFVLGRGEVNISTAASCHPQAALSPSHLHLWNGLRLSYARHRRQALLLDFATMLKHLKPPEENPKRVEVTNDVTYTCHMPRKKCNL